MPALGFLAADGNRVAQVLVGLIDVSPRLQGPWLAQRARAERMALLRAPATKARGQLSGVNWLRLWDGAAGPEVMLDFARLGEPTAARTAARRLALTAIGGWGGLADLGPPSETLVDAKSWAHSTRGMSMLAQALPPPARLPTRLGAVAADRCLMFLSALAEEDRRETIRKIAP